MQDSQQGTYDKAFVDKHWNGMKQQLDSKMPVAVAKPSNLVTQLLCGLLVISILSTLYFAHKYKASNNAGQQVTERIIYKDRYITVPTPANASKKVKNLIIDKKTLSEKNQQTITQNSANAKSSLANSTGENIKQKSAIALKLSTLISALDMKDISIFKIHEDLEKLESEVPLLDNKTSKPSIVEEKLDEGAEAERSVKYNLGLQTLITNDLDYTGYGIQSAMEFPLGKKLGFATGLAVNFLSREQYFTPTFPRENGIEENVEDGLAPLNSTDKNSYYDNLKGLKQVYLPVSVNYELSTSLAINSGLRLRYTYYEDLGDQLINQNSRRSMPVLENGSVFNNANIGLSAGLKYQLNNHFSILLDSEWGMNSLIRNPELTDPNNRQYDLNIFNLTTNYTF